MELYLDEKTFAYELENVARMFERGIHVSADGIPQSPEEDFAAAWRAASGCETELFARAAIGGINAYKTASLRDTADNKEIELELARLLFFALSEITGKRPEWGVITGIRPAKFAGLMLKSAGEREVTDRLESRYLVSPRKAKLCVETALASGRLAALNAANSFSLYISIPFCPTRCSYCSFVSKTIEREGALVGPYVEKLCEELAYSGAIAERLGLKLESVYVGGGTPTTLTTAQLRRLCAAVAENFDLASAREFTVEAGRPDTISADKLAALKNACVTRVSINPQTGSDEVLRAIGRRHTSADIERAFDMARKAGFDNINADLIAGLTTDTLEDFEHTLRWLEPLRPENITLHALTLKRASDMTERGDEASPDAAAMVAYANDELPKKGYRPYYMYKQKGTVDCLENTGYALEGKECLYNIYIMDEVHTIIACGAGAVTKLVNQKSGLIERVFNYKYPAEYLSGFDRLLERKNGIERFYED